jgi:hypothetical protein
MSADFVSGSAIRNYLLNDPLVDWLEYMYKRGKCDYTPTPTPFQEELFRDGEEFEAKIVSYLKEKYIDDIKTVATAPEDLYGVEKFEATKRLISEGVPIIYQGVVKNVEKGIGGICDLIVRSDFLNRISKDHGGTYSVEDNNDPHYVVVDIKLSRLALKTDGTHLKNSRNYGYYKGQLYIYNEALKTMQTHSSNSAYILGRGWEYTKSGEKISAHNCLERLGKVDFSDEDSFVCERVENAVVWLRKLRNEGETWSLFPPSVQELRPNMAIDSGRWQKAKSEIAQQQNDVTMLLSCGHYKRRMADKLGISSWKKCNSNALEIKSEKRKRSVNRSIRLNKKREFEIVPKRISKSLLKKSTLELYLDYETFYKKDEMIGVEAGEGKTVVFLIGCGFVVNDIWSYKSFVLERCDIDEEKKLFSDFLDEIKCDFLNEDVDFKIYSWGTTEKIIYEKLTGDTNLFSDKNYVDLLKLFRHKSISMKGCFSYSLKEVARALHTQGLIKTIWDEDSSVKNGYEAMKEGEKLFTGDKSKLPDLINYNEIDCKIMWEIMTFLRKP